MAVVLGNPIPLDSRSYGLRAPNWIVLRRASGRREAAGRRLVKAESFIAPSLFRLLLENSKRLHSGATLRAERNLSFLEFLNQNLDSSLGPD